MGGALGTSAPKPPVATNVSMLLLGAPSVGKSTVFRQMKLKYLNEFAPGERILNLKIIRRNVISALLTLDEAVGKLGLNLESDEAENAVTTLKLALSEYEDDLHDLEEEDDEAALSEVADSKFPANAVLALFKDAAVQRAYQQILNPTSEIGKIGVQARELSGTAMPYFLAKLKEVCADDYKPSNEDCLHLRRATTGTETIEFKTQVETGGKPTPVNVTCKDIGGQAQEQQKWELHSKGVDVVMFIAAVSDFDTILPDGSNALNNQFELLRHIYNAECFKAPQIVVVLNKMDLIEEKLKTKKLASYFPAFNGVNDEVGAVEFMIDECETIISQTQNVGTAEAPQQANIVPITAFDSDMIAGVIAKSISAAICRNLVSIGFMS